MSGRLIDADKLLSEYQTICSSIRCYDCQFNGEWGDKGCQLEALIKDAPTAEKHAHWEWDDELGANVCSSCGRPTYDSHDEYVEFMGSKVLALVSPHYCGFCGAKMDGGDAE